MKSKVSGFIYKTDKKILLAVTAAAVLIVTAAAVALGITAAKSSKRPVSAPSADIAVQLSLLGDVSSSDALINKYYVYGNHLHLEGEIDGTKYNGFSRISLILRKDDGSEKEITLKYGSNDSGTVFFTSSEYINSGICLDEIAEGDLCVLFKIADASGKIYTSAAAMYDFEPVNYYTVTKNGENRLVSLGFTAYSTGKGYSALPCDKS